MTSPTGMPVAPTASGIGGPFGSPFNMQLGNNGGGQTQGYTLNDLINASAPQASAPGTQTPMGQLYPGINSNGGVGTIYGPGLPGQPGGVGGPSLEAANQQAAMQQQAQSMSPLDQLLAQEQSQMGAIGNISNYEMPYSQIQSMANNMVDAQYDPQINNLLGQIAQQKQLTSVNQGKASDMYNALAQSFSNDIPAVQQQTQQEAAQTKAQYAQSQQQLQQQYQNQSGQQQAALNKLGIQAAQGGGSAGNSNVAAQPAPGVQGVGQQQATDQNYLQGQMALQNQQAQNQLAQQGSSAVQYQQAMANSSQLQGQNDVTNLQNALQNYLTGAQTQQQSLVGAKSDALAGELGQLQWQNIQNAQTQYQNAFNRVLAQNQFGLGVQQEQDTNTNNMNTLLAQLQENQNQYGSGTVNRPGTTGNSGGIQGAATELSNLYAGGNSGIQTNEMSGILQAVQNAMTQANNQNTFAQTHSERVRTDMPFYQGYLQQALQQQGITDPSDMAAAYQALLAYNSQLK